MAADIQAIGIAVERRGVLVNPRNGAAHLRRHHPQIAAHLLHRGKIRYDVMCASRDKHLSRIPEVPGFSAKPVAAMDHHEDRCPRAIGSIDIELFNFRRSVRNPPWRTDAGTYSLAVGGEARIGLPAERFVIVLVISSVE